MGKRRGRSGGGEGVVDQFGEYGISQDRDEHFASNRGGFRGGGSAGGRSRSGPDVSYQRHIPKFLQPYAHMIDKKKNPHEPVVVVEKEEEEEEEQEEDDAAHAEAVRRAIEDNPEIAKELGEDVVKKAEAVSEKEKGNTAYAHGEFENAIKHFTKCIELDPEGEVYYSNRSASYGQIKNFEMSLRDARSVIRLKPKWVKGWARMAAAHFGLEEYSQAKEAYEKALEIEPEDKTLQEGKSKAEAMERKQIRDHKHTFSKRHFDERGSRDGPRRKRRHTEKGVKNSKLLSFDDDNEGS